MTQKNDGGAAFPRPYGHLPDHPYHSGNTATVGMSLRDWFAGQALAGQDGETYYRLLPESVAQRAYLVADAMLAARQKGGDQ